MGRAWLRNLLSSQGRIDLASNTSGRQGSEPGLRSAGLDAVTKFVTPFPDVGFSGGNDYVLDASVNHGKPSLAGKKDRFCWFNQSGQLRVGSTPSEMWNELRFALRARRDATTFKHFKIGEVRSELGDTDRESSITVLHRAGPILLDVAKPAAEFESRFLLASERGEATQAWPAASGFQGFRPQSRSCRSGEWVANTKSGLDPAPEAIVAHARLVYGS